MKTYNRKLILHINLEMPSDETWSDDEILHEALQVQIRAKPDVDIKINGVLAISDETDEGIEKLLFAQIDEDYFTEILLNELQQHKYFLVQIIALNF